MANTKSAKKGVQTSERNRQRNVHYRSRLKTVLKTFNSMLQNHESVIGDTLNGVIKIIDQTTAKGILKKGTANRMKSRIMKAVNSQSTKKPAVAGDVVSKQAKADVKSAAKSTVKSAAKSTSKSTSKSTLKKPSSKSVKLKSTQTGLKSSGTTEKIEVSATPVADADETATT